MNKQIALLLVLAISACTSKNAPDFSVGDLRLELTIETHLEQDESGNQTSNSFSPRLSLIDSKENYLLVPTNKGYEIHVYLDSVQVEISSGSCPNDLSGKEFCAYYINLAPDFAKEPHQISIEIIQNKKLTAQATFNTPGNFALLQPSDTTNPIKNGIPFILEWDSKNHPKTVELVGSGQDCMASNSITDIPTSNSYLEVSTNLLANDSSPCALYQNLFLTLTEDTNIQPSTNQGFGNATIYWENYYSFSLQVND